jgi:hypothetical protein
MPSDRRFPAGAATSRHRMSALLGSRVLLPDGGDAGFVTEIRLAGGPGLHSYVVEGLIVGPRVQGSMLGYDRRQVLGPWLVRAIVRLVNRDLAYVPWASVRRIDWDERIVAVDRLGPLTQDRPGR